MNEITKLARDLRNNQTAAEKIIWTEIRKKKLGVKFRRQHPIIYRYNNDSHFFICDFACIEKKLIIEIDGKIHEQQQTRDQAREYFIKTLGFTVIRFTNDMVINDINKVKEIIFNQIHPGRPYPADGHLSP